MLEPGDHGTATDHQATTRGDHEPTTSRPTTPAMSQPPADQPTDYQGEPVPIAVAARILGVSENAIRQRIKRGTVDAVKVDGTWQVTLSEPHRPPADYQSDQENLITADHQPAPVNPAAIAQLEAIRETWLQPLVDQVERLGKEAGQLRAERDAAEARARDLEQRLTVLEAGPISEPDAAEAQTAQREPPGRTELVNEDEDTRPPATTAPRGWVHRLAALFRGDR